MIPKLEEAGHLIPMEKPKELAAIIMKSFKEVKY
jgi:hypothetical protein